MSKQLPTKIEESSIEYKSSHTPVESEWENLGKVFEYIELNHKDEVISGVPLWKLGNITKSLLLVAKAEERKRIEGVILKEKEHWGMHTAGNYADGAVDAISDILTAIK